MKFETIERCGRTHVVRNGVESESFAKPGYGDYWLIYQPDFYGQASSRAEALSLISAGMDTWYTTSQAAEALAEMGAFDEPPSTQRVAGWCREGLLPGAVKVRGRGARGSGGSWRIPKTGLQALANERRKE